MSVAHAASGLAPLAGTRGLDPEQRPGRAYLINLMRDSSRHDELEIDGGDVILGQLPESPPGMAYAERSWGVGACGSRKGARVVARGAARNSAPRRGRYRCRTGPWPTIEPKA